MLSTLNTPVPSHQLSGKLFANASCAYTTVSVYNFTSIISSIRSYALRVAYSLCRGQPQLTADDLVQDAVIALWQYYCRLPDETERTILLLHAKAALITTLRYVFANQQRLAQGQMRVRQQWISNYQHDLDTTKSSFEDIIMALREWLQHCTPHQRKLWLMLATFRSYHEIAQHFGCTEAKIRQETCRLKKSLVQALHEGTIPSQPAQYLEEEVETVLATLVAGLLGVSEQKKCDG